MGCRREHSAQRKDRTISPRASDKKVKTTSSAKVSSITAASSFEFTDESIEKLVEGFTKGLGTVVEALTKEVESLHVAIENLSQQVQAMPRIDSVLESNPSASRFASDTECQVAQCSAPALAKQLCETHYRIMRRALTNGDTFELGAQQPVQPRGSKRSCTHEECEEGHYAKGLCRRHYMAARSRLRAADRQRPISDPLSDQTYEDPSYDTESRDEESDSGVEAYSRRPRKGAAQFDPGNVEELFDDRQQPTWDSESLPTAEMVSRVVAQYRGGLDRVAEVLGRNKRSLIDLMDHLDLMPYVAKVREAERQRVESATLRERLDDLLFREKLLEDLGFLKEIDDRARIEVQELSNEFANDMETVDEVLTQLSIELDLEEAGMKRLIWRYDLRRYLRSLGLRTNQVVAKVAR